MIFAYFEYLGYKSRFYGVMVSTLDFESSDGGSNPPTASFVKDSVRSAPGALDSAYGLARRAFASTAMRSGCKKGPTRI